MSAYNSNNDMVGLPGASFEPVDRCDCGEYIIVGSKACDECLQEMAEYYYDENAVDRLTVQNGQGGIDY